MSESPPPTVFFSRCKPHGVDAVDIATTFQRVFFGYTQLKAGTTFDRHNLAACLVDVSRHRDEWGVDLETPHDDRRQHSKNHNFVRAIAPGSIAMIPDVRSGVIHCGRVGPFRLDHNEAAYRAFAPRHDRELPDDAAKDGARLAGEIAQGWDVPGGFVAIPVPQIPASIRRSLFGRSTYGLIKPNAERPDPYQTMSDLMERSAFKPRPWTLDPAEVSRRISDIVTPSMFESLVVSLLQLDDPKLMWLPVGGSGDGGVDGIAADETGAVVALLQCKWHYSGGPVFAGTARSTFAADRPASYLATSSGNKAAPDAADVILDRSWLIEKILQHRAKLPLALTLRVGHAPSA